MSEVGEVDLARIDPASGWEGSKLETQGGGISWVRGHWTVVTHSMISYVGM